MMAMKILTKISQTSPPLRVALATLAIAGCFTGLFIWKGQGFMVGHADKQEDHRQEIGVWSKTDVVEQAFIASHDNLARIDIYLDSYYPWHSPSLEFRLFEIDTTEIPANISYDRLDISGKPVRTVLLNGWLLSSHMFNSITFEPLPDSTGKRYLVSLQSPDLKDTGMFILMGSPEDSYDEGSLWVNGRQHKGDLAFRALYQRPRWEIVQQWVALVILAKPWPFAWPPLYSALVILYIAGVLGLGRMLLRPPAKKP